MLEKKDNNLSTSRLYDSDWFGISWDDGGWIEEPSKDSIILDVVVAICQTECWQECLHLPLGILVGIFREKGKKEVMGKEKGRKNKKTKGKIDR